MRLNKVNSRMSNALDNISEHTKIWLLIPWYANESLEVHDRRRVDDHARTCTACRNELKLQQSIYNSMFNASTVDYMPQASLRRFHERLDALEDSESTGVVVASVKRTHRFWSAPHSWAMVASIAALVGAVGVFVQVSVQTLHRPVASNYFTVTDSAPRINGALVRAVFTSSITLTELQTLVTESKLRIVAGPTDAGVYSLAPTGAGSISESLTRLRASSKVRFAEGVQTSDGQ